MAVATTQQLVSALYVAVFNRAPDKAGLDSWTAQINGGRTFAQVASGFTAHEVFTTGIGALGNAEFVAALYTNVLGSAGDAAGVAGWVAQLAAGTSKAAVAASFVQAALTVDIPALLAAGTLTAADAAAATIRQNTLTNKADAGIYFADTLGARSNLNANTVASSKAGLEADPIYNASKAAIASVTNTPASLQAAKDAIAVAAGTTNPAQALLGNTFTLTTGADTFTGGPSADTFNADQTTFGVLDSINGGAGKDTLNLTDSGTAAWTVPAAQVTNVEVVNVRNVNGTPSTAAVAAVTEASTVTFNALTNGQTVTLAGLTYTAGAGGSTAVEVAAAFSAGIAALTATGAVTGALNGYSVAAGTTGPSTVFTSTVAGNVTDLSASGTGTVNAISTVQGTTGTAAVVGTGVTDTLNASNFVGGTNFNSNLSTNGLTITNLVAGQQVGVTGNNAVINTAATALSADYAAAATSATLNIAGGTKVSVGNGAVAITGTGLTSATINSTGAANTVGAISIGSTLTSATINAETNLTTTGLTGFAAASAATNTLTVAGIASSVSVGTLTNVNNVNASGLTLGGLTADISTNANIKFTGGAGNDVVTSAGVLLAAGSSVDAGAGTADRLILTTAIDVATVATATANKASAALYKGFEELQVNNGVTQDASAFTGSSISKIVLNGATAGVTNVSAAQAANIQALSSGTYTVGVTGASTVGQLDTVKITADDGVAAVSTITLTTPVLANVETLQLVAVDNLIVSSLTGAPALTSVQLSGAGTINVSTGAVAFAANSTIDASAATGVVTIDASQATTNGVSIKGGAGNDILTGSAQADTIVGGAGNDTISGGAGADILTGGTGANTFQFAVGNFTAANTTDLIAARSTITDWAAGAGNKVDFAAGLTIGTAATTAVSGVAQISNTGLANFFTSDNTLALKVAAVAGALSTANASAVFTDGGNSYLFVSNGTTGVGAGDALIQLTGVNATTGLTIVSGDITAVA